MKEKKLYTCEFCNTDYADIEKAKRCEANHKRLSGIGIQCKYKSINSIPDGMPTSIVVVFEGGKTCEYKR